MINSDANFPSNLGRLSEIPRVALFSGRTPLEPMPNLAKSCGGLSNLYVKRDDCTELAFGGNKVRHLEFYLGEALAQNADTVLITGAVQSNFVRLAAAGARKLGMDCHVQLEERVATNDPDYRTSGNVLLNQLFGATMYSYPEGEDEVGADRKLGVIAKKLSDTGRRPYIILLAPGHVPLGALGYIIAAQEILEQINEQGLEINEIVVASGSGNTHAGLLFGLRALDSAIKVTGICVRRDATIQRSRIEGHCSEIAELLSITSKVSDEDIVLNDAFLAPGYGIAGEECSRAILLGAQTEGLVLDHSYTGKSMAGFIERARSADDNPGLLFLHTGGGPAIFAHQKDLIPATIYDP